MKIAVDEDDTVMIMSLKLCLLDIKNWQQQIQMLDVHDYELPRCCENWQISC